MYQLCWWLESTTGAQRNVKVYMGDPGGLPWGGDTSSPISSSEIHLTDHHFPEQCLTNKARPHLTLWYCFLVPFFPLQKLCTTFPKSSKPHLSIHSSVEVSSTSKYIVSFVNQYLIDILYENFHVFTMFKAGAGWDRVCPWRCRGRAFWGLNVRV